MTRDQFNEALARCITIEADRENGGLPCYPIIGIGGDADCFCAYDNNRQVLLAGVYAETEITQDTIARASYCAFNSMVSNTDENTTVIPCILIRITTIPMAYSEDVLLYFVTINADGLLEFTDFDDVDFGDDDDNFDDEASPA